MPDERYYLMQVNKLLENLRATCLGQNTPLTDILPIHLKTAPLDKQAAQLAEQILFALVRVIPGKQHSPHELQRCRTWLHGTARYLLEQCNDADHTFAQWKKLLDQPKGVRLLLYTNFHDASSVELKNGDPPDLLREFDVAILWLLGTQGLAESAHTVYQKLLGENIL